MPDPTDQSDRRPLADHHLDELGAGLGSAATVDLLARHQLALGRELLGLVWHDTPHDALGEAAWETLTELDLRAQESVDAVLAHPYVRPWALRSLQGDAEAAEVAMRGVAEIAAAAAVRAGHAVTVTVPVRDGLLRLPTLGALAACGDTAEVRVSSDGFVVAHEGGRIHPVAAKGHKDFAWQGRWGFEFDGWAVALEDTDPWRDCHGHRVHPRLTEDEAEAWRADLAAAWQWIRRELPAYAPGIAAGLRNVTPLLPSSESADISSAARDAFGAVAIARPATPQQLALLLVHEFQHVKLGAVLDLTDLHDPTCERLFYAPWRPDPRPLEGLLQGTYAHIAVIDFWRARWRSTTGDEAHAAEAQFSRWREQTAEAVETLAASGALTPQGERFVAGMRDTVRALLADEIGEDALQAARQAAEEHRAAWEAVRPG